jgi:hypothetical protein
MHAVSSADPVWYQSCTILTGYLELARGQEVELRQTLQWEQES